MEGALQIQGQPGTQRKTWPPPPKAALQMCSIGACVLNWIMQVKQPCPLHAQVCLLQPGTPLQVRLPASQMAAMTSNSAVKSCRLKFRSPQMIKFYYCVYVGTCLCVYRHIHAFTLNHLINADIASFYPQVCLYLASKNYKETRP